MAQKHIVQCRICKEKFDTTPLKEGVDWIMPSKNWYYHCKCYNDWNGKKKNNIKTNIIDEELWKDATYQYLHRGLKIGVDFGKFNAQFGRLIKKGRTPKGIYFAVRYFYEIEKGDKTKADGGIGIVDYIYDRSKQYWIARERDTAGIVSRIEQQVKELAQAEQVVIKKQPKKKKLKYTLEMVEELD